MGTKDPRASRKSFVVHNLFPYPLLLDREGSHCLLSRIVPAPEGFKHRPADRSDRGGVGPSSHIHVPLTWGLSNIVQPLAVSPDGRDLVVYVKIDGPVEGDAVVWNLQTRAERLFVKGVCLVAVSPDGLHLAGSDRRTIGIWDFRTGERVGGCWCAVRSSESGPQGIWRLAYSPDGKLLVAAITRGLHFPSWVGVWHVGDTQSPQSFVATAISCRRFVIPETHKLVTGSGDKTVRIWALDKLSGPAGKNRMSRTSSSTAMEPETQGRFIDCPLVAFRPPLYHWR